MLIYVWEEELYPDYELFLDPLHYAIRCEVPDELVEHYVEARRTYLDLRDRLRSFVEAGVKIGAVEGLTYEAVKSGAYPDPRCLTQRKD